MSKSWLGVAALLAAAGSSGCALDNSGRIERERREAESAARVVQAEENVTRLQLSCQGLERALNEERDARQRLQQRLDLMEEALEQATEEPAKPAAPAPKAKPAPGKELTGEAAAVARIQEALRRAGYDPGPADGKWGQKTKSALMAFQKDNGLKADGAVGPKTLEKLKAHLSEAGEPASEPAP